MVAMRSLIPPVATMAHVVAYGLDNDHAGIVKYLQPREITVTVTETLCPAAPQYPLLSTTVTLPFPGTPSVATTPSYETIPGYGTTQFETSSASSTPIPVTSAVSSEASYPSIVNTGASDKSATKSNSVTTETYTATSKTATNSSAMTATVTPKHSTMAPPSSTASSTLPASGGAGPESVNIGLLGLVAMAVLF